MVLIAEYHLSCRALPLVGVSAAVPEMRLGLTVGQPNHAGLPPFFLQASGTTPEALETALDESGFVDEWARFGGDEQTHYYHLLPTTGVVEQLEPVVSDPSRLQTLATNRSFIRDIAVTPSGWIQNRWFADRDAFDEYRDFWRGNDVDIAVDRLFRPDADPQSRDALTGPQTEALTTAYELGYFEVPRQASLAEVADELGVTPPSLSERLRRAYGHLVEAHLSADDAIPTHADWSVGTE